MSCLQPTMALAHLSGNWHCQKFCYTIKLDQSQTSASVSRRALADAGEAQPFPKAVWISPLGEVRWGTRFWLLNVGPKHSLTWTTRKGAKWHWRYHRPEARSLDSEMEAQVLTEKLHASATYSWLEAKP